MLSPLGLQEIPPLVVTGLKSLSQNLPQHLSSTLGQYHSLLEAKLKPAHTFCNLLDRLIRANESGLNASKILGDPIETRKMRDDWTRFVHPQSIVAREVSCGSAEVQRILGEEVVQLLSTDLQTGGFDTDIKSEDPTRLEGGNSLFPFGKTNGILGSSSSNSVPDSSGAISKSEMIVLKWAQYLSSLPWRFPNVPARLFLLCMSALLTASLREISVNGGEGFGAWWVVRCWIDEWMGWLAEMGGFLAVNLDDVLETTQQSDKNEEQQRAFINEANGKTSVSAASAIPGVDESFVADLSFEVPEFKAGTRPQAGLQKAPEVAFPTRHLSDSQLYNYEDTKMVEETVQAGNQKQGPGQDNAKEEEELEVPKIDDSTSQSPTRPPVTLASPSSHDTKKHSGNHQGTNGRRLSFPNGDDLDAVSDISLLTGSGALGGLEGGAAVAATNGTGTDTITTTTTATLTTTTTTNHRNINTGTYTENSFSDKNDGKNNHKNSSLTTTITTTTPNNNNTTGGNTTINNDKMANNNNNNNNKNDCEHRNVTTTVTVDQHRSRDICM